ncbi:hypothetical protein C9374_013337 [Naegleria lovaniensis]|uniref:Uncharacterized protein n=1 Tax=Naegleria lovaniensis TaxID=51637 RepID=A0AA88KQ23_NAELO|nr:uncharacterized protein C9374_013337 [Naegleria lovaniensis]KAG2391852.1 hypothetical protein C9374_013337 [Naegleria lovaniensis]
MPNNNNNNNTHSAPPSNEHGGHSTLLPIATTTTGNNTTSSTTPPLPISNPSTVARKLSNSGTMPPSLNPSSSSSYYSVPPPSTVPSLYVPPPPHHAHPSSSSSAYYPPYPYASYLPPSSMSTSTTTTATPTTPTTTTPSSQSTATPSNPLLPPPPSTNALYYSPHYPLYPSHPHQQPPHPHSLFTAHQPMYSGTPPGMGSVAPSSHPMSSHHPMHHQEKQKQPSTTKKKKKSKNTITTSPVAITVVNSSCPTDPWDISRKSLEKINLIEGFTMDRILQHVTIPPMDNDCVISEKQTVKIDSSLKNQYSSLKLQVWLCELCVDKITENITALRSLYDEVLTGSNDEVSVQDLIFPTTIISSGRKEYFLRFVLYDAKDKNTEIVAFCDTCTFEIRSKTRSPTRVQIQNNQSVAALPPQRSLTLSSTAIATSETPSSASQSVGEKPTLDFLKRLIATATLSEDINSWDTFMHTLNQLVVIGDSSFLNTSSGSLSKRADFSDHQMTKEFLMRGHRKTNIYPYIEQCYPAFGPARGGIQISINVKDLNIYDEDDLIVTFDDIKVPKTDFVSIRPNKILLYLPALSSNHILGKVDVAISVRNELEDFCHVLYDSFEYLSNDVFEKKKSSIPTPIERPSSNNKNINQVLIRPLSETNSVNEDLFTKTELYNSETTKYVTTIYFEPGFLKGSPLDPSQRFIWLLRKSDTFENLIGNPSSKEIDCGGVFSIKDLLPTVKEDILEIPIEIDRKISTEKFNCTMVLQLYDIIQKQIHYTSRPFSILQKAPKPVAYSSFNEDERVLQLLEKIKTPRARKMALRGGALDPTLNYLGQTKTHIACLSGNETELKRNFQPAHLTTHDLFLRNPLHLAFASGNLEAAKFCIENLTTSPHLLLLQRDYYHNTPFHLALKFNRTHFMKEICLVLKTYLIRYLAQQSTFNTENSNTATMEPYTPKSQIPTTQPVNYKASSQKKRKTTSTVTTTNSATPPPPKKTKQEEGSSDEEEDDVLVVEEN